MAHQKRRAAQMASTWEWQAEEVLARAARPSAAEVLALIRQINPTGRDLEPSVSRRRYQLKSQLQSLLLRHHLSDIEITAERERQGILLLRHRYVDRNQSTHAVLEELAEDVRARVQHQLDSQVAEHIMMPYVPEPPAEVVEQGPSSTSAPRRKAKVQAVSGDQDPTVDLDLSVAELIRRGCAAILDYDYEAARAQLGVAVRVSHGALAAVLPMLELLVESLALYPEALELVPLLSPDSEAEPAVRALLGLAAACSGEASEAEYWLAGLDDLQAAPVWLALTERAIQDGDAASASERLTRARELGAAVADLLPLEARLFTLCQKTWRDAEQQLELLRRAGDLERAEPQARALLLHWPTSPVAQRVVASSAAWRRRLECERLQREAEEALAAQDFAAAAQQMRAAKALGADTEMLEQRLAAAVEMAQARCDAEQVERIVPQLQHRPSAALLHQYVTLAGRLRSRVRERVATPLLVWLDQLAVPALGARAQDAAVEAVLALQHADSQSDPDAVLAVLSTHEKVLERVAHFRVVVSRAQAASTAQRQRSAQQHLAAAEAALAAGADTEAAERLARIEPRHLDAACRERTAVVQARLERRRELARRREELSALLLAGNLLGAQEQARALLSLCEPEELSFAVARCDEIAERIRAEWGHRVYRFDGVPLSELPYVGAVVSHDAIQLPIHQSLVGDELTLATTCGEWLFLWVLSVGRRQLGRVVVLRTPHPLGLTEVVATTDGLWLVGEDHLLLLAPTTYDVRLFRDVREFLKPDQRLEQLYLLPQAGYLWIGCDDAADRNRMLVVDIRRWRLRREVTADPVLQILAGDRAQRVAALLSAKSPRLFDPSGSSPQVPDFPGQQIHAMAVHPQNDSLIALVSAEHDVSNWAREGVTDSGSQPLLLAESPIIQQRLADSHVDSAHVLFAALGARLALVAYANEQDHIELQAFQAGAAMLERSWRTELPCWPIFARDVAGQRAVVVVPTARGLDVAELGTSPPPLDPSGRRWTPLPPLLGHTYCYPRGEELPASVGNVFRPLYRGPAQARKEALARLRAEYQGQPGLLLAIAGYISEADRSEHMDYIEQHYPDLPMLALQRAEHAAERVDLVALRHWLQKIEDGKLPGTARRHFLHLEGSVRFHQGDLPGALVAWRQAMEQPGGCQLEECIAWLDAFDGPKVDTTDPLSETQQLAAALRLADRCLGEKDAAGAVAALERPVLLAFREGQSLARLAAAYLQRQVPSGLPLLRKAEALALFCGWFKEGSYRKQILVPGATYDAQQLAALNADAAAWLLEALTAVPLVQEGR